MVTGSNVEATAQFDEPAVNTGGHSVWYRWVAPLSGTATFRATDTDFSILLAAFGEPLDGSSTITEVVLLAFTNGSAITWSTEPGHIFWIAVDGAGGATGNFVLNWDSVADGRLPDLIPSVHPAPNHQRLSLRL